MKTGLKTVSGDNIALWDIDNNMICVDVDENGNREYIPGLIEITGCLLTQEVKPPISIEKGDIIVKGGGLELSDYLDGITGKASIRHVNKKKNGGYEIEYKVQQPKQVMEQIIKWEGEQTND